MFGYHEEAKDDGQFWMSWEDFLQQFKYVQVGSSLALLSLLLSLSIYLSIYLFPFCLSLLSVSVVCLCFALLN